MAYTITAEQASDLKERFTYHAPKGDQTVRYQQLRDKAHEYAAMIMELTPPGREQATALTELVRVNMLANAAIAIGEA